MSRSRRMGKRGLECFAAKTSACARRFMMANKAMVCVLLFCVMVMAGAGSAYCSEGFESTYDNLNVKKNTKLHVKEYWKKVDGKEVVWSGGVFDVKGGRGKAEIRVASKSRPAVKGYNVTISVFDIEKAARLKKGQHIRFRGYLRDYDSGRHGGVRIALRDAEIL